MQGAHTVFGPASPQAAAIAHLAHLFIWVALLVWLTVMGVLTLALLRSRRRDEPRLARRQLGAVATALGLSTLLLLALGFVDYGTGRGIATARAALPDTLRITLIGRQWWWELQYQQATPPYRLTTANEMHIPLRRPVLLTLQSSDVIHSFWAPNLHGKVDLIPSYASQFLIQADSAGVFRAPCAEFCGAQHAKMALLIVAEPADSFAAWYANQQRPAAPPGAARAARGREVFLTRACPLCHTIRGTPSGGTIAPDLTHLASRTTLAAGTLPNERALLAGWVANPQGPKPGNQMPANLVSGAELNALLDYLVTLK